jgi:hypothetical protein
MTLPRIFFVVCLVLFGTIGVLALVKKERATVAPAPSVISAQEVDLALLSSPAGSKDCAPLAREEIAPICSEEDTVLIEHEEETDGLSMLFCKGSNCPIVETVSYKSRVPWKQHRPAWLIDYAHGNCDDVPKSVSEGAQFNVYRNDLEFRFHLVVSLSSCKMRLYYVIPQEKRVVFLHSYQVCVGRKNSSKASGCLTPLGLYQLGQRVGVYHPRMMGLHKGKKVEMIQVFGAYWIPFEQEVEGCSEPARGFGIHGTPIRRNDEAGGRLEEDNSSIGHCESDGCIRLSGPDIKELFSVISTRKTYVEIVPSFQQSKLLRGEI